MMNDPRVIWGADGWAETDGWERANCADTQTGEYMMSHHVWVSRGCSLPACAHLDAPMDAVEGKARIRSNGAWALVDDHRGAIVYDKASGQQHSITDIGPLADTVTTQPPPSQFSVWNYTTGGWESDAVAEQQGILQQAKAQQAGFIATANQQIAIIQPAVEGGYATLSDTDALPHWQRYRYALTQIDKQPGWPESPQWPDQPSAII